MEPKSHDPAYLGSRTVARFDYFIKVFDKALLGHR